MNLSETIIGRSYQVAGLQGERDVVRRLESLGIFEGTRVDVLNKKDHGAVIIKVRGSRWAIGRKLAENIEIQEEGKL